MQKTWAAINNRIQEGKAVVLTAEEVKEMAQVATAEEIVEEVDVVTTGTFGPMCSSGAFFNFGHPTPPIKMEEITLNEVPAYGGLAAVDAYLGATAQRRHEDTYGGAHVLEDLLQGKEVLLEARGRVTHCYPRPALKTYVHLQNLNEALLFNPRNAYQNYVVATNSSQRLLHTYMGTLLPNMENANYSTAGALSPLLNCPDFQTLGVGTRIFLGGTQGYIAGPGTQFHYDQSLPQGPGGTLAVMGDLKAMSSRYLKAASYTGYGVSLFVGLGIPIPILNADIARAVSIRNRDIRTSILDFGAGKKRVATIDYEQLQSGTICIQGQKIRTASLSSIPRAREIALALKEWIAQGEFFLTPPVEEFRKKTLRSLSLQEWPREGEKALSTTAEDCIHCGACTAVCSNGALTVRAPTFSLAYNREICNFCQACQEACPLQRLPGGYA